MKIICREDIKKIIPHREPMLLIDEINISEGGTVAGKYYFTGDEWFFKGHYPDKPIVPGVIICEIMAQASCSIFLQEVQGKTPYLISIANAKFRKTILPKDTINVICSIINVKGPFYYVKSKGFVNDVLCAESELSFYIEQANLASTL